MAVKRERPSLVFEAELDDGTGVVVLRWPGRRWVTGVRCGAVLRVEGTVQPSWGRPVVLNPLYELCR
jgi:hypothetical protein